MPSKNKTQKKFVRKNCAPMVKNKTINKKSCFTDSVIYNLKDEYNKVNNNAVSAKTPNGIWKQLKSKLKDCNSELCWLDNLTPPQIKKKIKEKSFTPDAPNEWKKDPNTWLTNFDIEKVMKQYESSFPNFEFIGTTFIDFDAKEGSSCVEEELCKFDLKNLINKKKNKVGIIFNLDKHTENGSHWVSMFVDIENKFIFYFDSAGAEIPDQMMNLVKRIQNQGNTINPKIAFKFHQNFPLEHQYENTECGMYSLFFNITLLSGKIYDKKATPRKLINFFKNKRIPDKKAELLRSVYYN